MVTMLAIYRNRHGEVFFRLSGTHGRTARCRIVADSVAHMERWLRDNGYLMLEDEPVTLH